MSKSRRFSASKRNAHRANRSVREGSNGVSASTRQMPNKFSSAGVGVLADSVTRTRGTSRVIHASSTPLSLRSKVEFLVVGLLALCAAYALMVVSHPSSGVLTLADGAITYEGGMLHGRMDGAGTMTFDNGDTYKGQFKDGAFNGSGTFTSKDSWTYEGNFVNGEPDGEGTLTTEDSIVYQGIFKQGIYQSAN